MKKNCEIAILCLIFYGKYKEQCRTDSAALFLDAFALPPERTYFTCARFPRMLCSQLQN